MEKKSFAGIVSIAFLLAINTLQAQTLSRDIKTPEYKEVQSRLGKGWNTWYNNSVISHALLPEGFSINLCIATKNNKDYLKEVFKASDIVKRPEKVLLGLRADDGSYTSLKLEYMGQQLSIETATDGTDEIILIVPEKPSENVLVTEAALLWGMKGTIGALQNNLIGKFGNKTILVSSTAKPVDKAYALTTAPHLAFTLNQDIGIYTGKARSLASIKEIIRQHRAVQQKRVASYGDLSESYEAMQNILAWNTIYDAPNHRVITPVSRMWNRSWGGFVLFEWDNYFASYMLSMFNKDLAYANAIEITKAITPEGFVPNFQSVGSYKPDGNTSSWDRSQPPVGSTVVLNIYKKHQEKWFLTEVYDELLTWNRWWTKNRDVKGYLAWGSYERKDDTLKNRTESLIQSAKYESGLDNSPMYDGIPFNTQTHAMELADVGLISMYIMDCNSLAEISTVLGKTKDAEELKARASGYTKTLATLWNDQTGIFLNKRLDVDSISYRLSPTNFYPMLAKAATPEQAARMVKEHYFNPKEFYGDYIMPSISRNDVAFKDNSYWRGRIWAPMNFLVYLGMQNYDVKEARMDLIAKSKNLLLKNWKESGGVFENYNAVNGKGNDVRNADGFYHWGALLTFMEFIERGYMKP